MKFYVTVGLCANSDAALADMPEVARYKIEYFARNCEFRQGDGHFVIKVCGSEDMI